MKIEPLSQSTHETTPEPFWWRFKPGNRANPRGRGRRKDKIAAHVQDIVVEFCARHNRKPTPSEIATIGSLALNLVNQANAPADSDRSARLSKEIRRDRQSLGLNSKPPADVVTPRRTAAEILGSK